MLCYAILYYAMLCYAILHYALLYFIALYYTILHDTFPRITALVGLSRAREKAEHPCIKPPTAASRMPIILRPIFVLRFWISEGLTQAES